jgi:D-glycero-D-manno-heptose 1,7-bisphosphate phosphatase
VNTHAVFLDRDGVLNRAVVRGGKSYPPSSLVALEILPDVEEALVRLKAATTTIPDVRVTSLAQAADWILALDARDRQ